MESLLPSEIARLVYGYLIEEKCSDAAAKFLETSSHLKECLSALQKGKSFQTKFDGRNLVTLLDILSQAKNQARILAADLPHNSLLSKKLLNLLTLLSVNVSKNVESIEDEEEEKIDGPNCVSDGSVYDMDCTVSDNRTEDNCSIEVYEDRSSHYSESSGISISKSDYDLNDCAVRTIQASRSFDSVHEDVATENGQSSDDLLSNADISSTDMEDLSDNFMNKGKPETTSPKRMRLGDKDGESIPEVEVIDLDTDEFEEIDGSCYSPSSRHIRSQVFASSKNRRNRNGRANEDHRNSNKNDSESREDKFERNRLKAPLPNRFPSSIPSARSTDSYQGPTLIKTCLPLMNPMNLGGAPVRFAPHHPLQPAPPFLLPTSNNFCHNSWIRESCAVPTASQPPMPLIMNRHVRSSSFGIISQGSSSTQFDSGVRLVTNNIVTHMVTTDRPRLTRQIIQNQSSIRPTRLH